MSSRFRHETRDTSPDYGLHVYNSVFNDYLSYCRAKQSTAVWRNECTIHFLFFSLSHNNVRNVLANESTG